MPQNFGNELVCAMGWRRWKVVAVGGHTCGPASLRTKDSRGEGPSCLPLKCSHMSNPWQNQQDPPADKQNHEKRWLIVAVSHKVLDSFVMQQ